ncbi:MAG TPA: DUF1614 domain-containing protein [Clostridiales bacterium]|nr:DUF1614 domain-containing protein [Clostridiales bacterium]
MPLGLTLLVVATILVLFGVGHQVLDRMRLNDKTAVLFMAGIFIGGLLPDISLGRNFSINLGGAVIPFILAVYLFAKAGTGREKARAVLASLVAGAAIYLAGRLLPHEPESMIFDPNYAYGIIAGVTAYLFGRSRRASFIAGIMGVILADIAQGIENVIRNIPAPVRLGSAGAVDAVVISGLLAVLLAEFVGELRERLQGGTEKKNMRFDHAEFTSAIGAEDKPEDNADKPEDKTDNAEANKQEEDSREVCNEGDNPKNDDGQKEGQT